MIATCKIDYGQYEHNENYEYYYIYSNNIKKYFVKGRYGENEFTKKQFESIFYQGKLYNINKNFNTI